MQEEFKSGKRRWWWPHARFGMGIDIPNIRMVVNFGIPGSLEELTQMCGHAGRDGLNSRVVLLGGPILHRLALPPVLLRRGIPPYAAYEQVWEYLHQQLTVGQTLRKSAATIAGEINRMHQTGLQEGSIYAILNTMESSGLIQRISMPGEPIITVVRDKLLAFNAADNPVALAMSNRYVRKEKTKYVELPVSISKLAEEAKVSSRSATALLRPLMLTGVVRVNPAFHGKSTRILRYKANLQEHLPLQNMEHRRSQELARLARLLDYAVCSDRVAFIRKYFLCGPMG